MSVGPEVTEYYSLESRWSTKNLGGGQTCTLTNVRSSKFDQLVVVGEKAVQKMITFSVNLKNIFLPNSNNELLQKSCVNDINSNIFRCNKKHQFQLDFYPSENFVSSVTKSIYDCVTLLGTILIN